jgi:cysteinyl-tRNA synthetase
MATFDYSGTKFTVRLLPDPTSIGWGYFQGADVSRASPVSFKMVLSGQTITTKGHDFVYADHRAVGGIVESITNNAGGTLSDLNWDIARFNTVYSTKTQSDDRALAKEVFAGDDSFSLSRNADIANGGGGNDKIFGKGGKDTISGGQGRDTLEGGSGKDHFLFDSKLSARNHDAITDFAHDVDVIALDHKIFSAIGDALSDGAFYAKRGATEAHDEDDRIIYDKKTGKLYYDADGNAEGGQDAIHFATLTTKPVIDADDFLIV